MALDESIKVPLPRQGIVRYKSGDVVYAYYITRIYRNKKGKPTNDRVSIGKIDNETGMLIPNKNYYEIYAKETPIKDNDIESIKSEYVALNFTLEPRKFYTSGGEILHFGRRNLTHNISVVELKLRP